MKNTKCPCCGILSKETIMKHIILKTKEITIKLRSCCGTVYSKNNEVLWVESNKENC